MKIINILIITSLILSCNTQGVKTEKKSSEEGDAKEQPSPLNCYQYASKTDTINLKLIHIGNMITGTLVYNLSGKDKNKGVIKGLMNDNLLIIKYTFMSEGVQSVRQVVFKSEANNLIEGYGETHIQNNEVLFKNLNTLKFNDSLKLIEIPCQ